MTQLTRHICCVVLRYLVLFLLGFFDVRWFNIILTRPSLVFRKTISRNINVNKQPWHLANALEAVLIVATESWIPLSESPLYSIIEPVAPVAYQVIILEPGIDRSVSCDRTPPSAYSNKFMGTFLAYKLTCGKRDSVS